jgi:hypothetical protein
LSTHCIEGTSCILLLESRRNQIGKLFQTYSITLHAFSKRQVVEFFINVVINTFDPSDYSGINRKLLNLLIRQPYPWTNVLLDVIVFFGQFVLFSFKTSGSEVLAS